ncbi:hypothetical protein E4U42_005603, partial [Claviceps africana]
MNIVSIPSLLATVLASSAAVLSSPTASPAEFDWLSLPPSWHLEYTSCYDGLDCARIHMPLDWLNRSDERAVTLAVLRVPATVPTSDPRHGGTLM